MDLPKEIRRSGFIYTLRLARKNHVCAKCRGLITKWMPYYDEVKGGSGVRGVVYADRYHPSCLKEKGVNVDG